MAVLEGSLAALHDMGLPLSVCIELQSDQLQLENAQWTLRRSTSGVSVSLFWYLATRWRPSESQSEGRQEPK